MGYQHPEGIEVTRAENVSMLTFGNVSTLAPFVSFSEIFKWVADEGINVDMISQTPPKSDSVTLAFTVSDDDFGKLLTVIGAVKEKYRGILPLVSSGNTKLRVYSPQMIHTVGMGARIFEALEAAHVQSLLITTSETDVSVLLAAGDADLAEEQICKVFSV